MRVHASASSRRPAPAIAAAALSVGASGGAAKS
jgi:hypothetical protein